jgi:hypothetical protein
MAEVASWDQFPRGIRQRLIDRMRDGNITISDLSQLRLWIESFARSSGRRLVQGLRIFKICGEGSLPRTFLLRGQPAKGQAL